MRLLRPAGEIRRDSTPDRHRHRQRRSAPRGQSLVEFAIVLPILLLLTLVALDFGRVYLGWINLQSMSRIAANLAANNPTAWQGGGDAAVQAKYQNQIKSDAAATNCQLPLVAGVRTAPAPVFTDTNANGATDDLGDSATVSISCTFNLITPGIKNIIGSSLTVSASSVFPVKSGMTSTMGGGLPAGSAPNAAFTGNGTLAPSTLSGTAPFTVTFRDTSGGSPTSWLWTFPDDSTTSTLQDPLDHTFTSPGTYIVTMTATNSLGSDTESMGITVTAPTTVDFSYSQSSPTAPSLVTFTNTSSAGGTAYAWSFGSGEGTSTQQNPTHIYNTAGTYSVTLTVTYPTGPVSVTKSITFGSALCTVPSFNGVKRNDAAALYLSKGFTGTVSDGPGAPNGNFTILSQSVTANSQYPCNGNITVNNP
jgi:PKD repeat protein